jgi:hypothetical protein
MSLQAILLPVLLFLSANKADIHNSRIQLKATRGKFQDKTKEVHFMLLLSRTNPNNSLQIKRSFLARLLTEEDDLIRKT